MESSNAGVASGFQETLSFLLGDPENVFTGPVVKAMLGINLLENCITLQKFRNATKGPQSPVEKELFKIVDSLCFLGQTAKFTGPKVNLRSPEPALQRVDDTSMSYQSSKKVLSTPRDDRSHLSWREKLRQYNY